MARRTPTRARAAGVAIAAIGLLLSGVAGPSAIGQAAAPIDDLPTALDGVFGKVTVTSSDGGPPHGGQTPREIASFTGTRDGDDAVLYRTDQSTCPDEPNYAPPCSVAETWIWNAGALTWALVPDADEPEGRVAASAAAMPNGATSQAWIYSGEDHQGGPYDAKLFVLGDDGHWSAAACNPSCGAGQLDGSMGATNGTDTLLYTGEDVVGGVSYPNQLYRWNGSDWDPLAVAGAAPPPRAAAGFTFDGRDFILFGGGLNTSGGTDYRDTWRLSKDAAGTWSWQEVCDQCAPPPRFQTTLVGLYRPGDPRHGAILIGGYQFGADDIPAALSDIWAWDGATWTLVAPGVAPCSLEMPAPCWSDPAIPWNPYSASMPALGAAAWTVGVCTAVDPNTDQVCTRRTVQVTLADVPATTTTAAAAPAQVTPAFTG